MGKSWQGQPVRPFAQNYVDAGNTVRLQVTSLDFDNTLETPTAFEWRLDNLTNDVIVQGWTSVTPANPTVITISAALNQMYGGSTWPAQDTQQMQVTVKATFADGSQALVISSYSLNAVYQGQ